MYKDNKNGTELWRIRTSMAEELRRRFKVGREISQPDLLQEVYDKSLIRLEWEAPWSKKERRR